MYKPSIFFMKQLKELDPKLGCEFNNNIGKFLITYKRVTGLPVPIIRVEREDGEFRYPDQREINALHESDTQRVSMKDRLDKASKYVIDYRINKQDEARENIRLMTRDDRLQLRRAIGRAAEPKADHSIFRRIIPKPKGMVFG